jgi:hypothetical protein
MKGQSLQTRFDDKYIPEPNSGCWIWLGGADVLGYGRLWYKGKVCLAHVVSYELHRGVPVHTGFELDHLCKMPCCVNPDHLEAVTHNMLIRLTHTTAESH